jgi:NAD(P)H dehydrogenase (quinone)
MAPSRYPAILVTLSKQLNCLTSYIQPLSDDRESETKRRVLLIHAHPVPESFNSSLASAVERGLSKAGHEVRRRNLYIHSDTPELCYGAGTFPAALSCEERKSYMDPQRAEELESLDGLKITKKLSKEVKDAAQDLRWCDAVVFVYPTWWYNVPAVLKGYLDRVLLPGIGFHLPREATDTLPARGFSGALSNVKKIGVVTTYGSPLYGVLYHGDCSRFQIAGGFRQICAPGCTVLWKSLYNMDFTSNEQRLSFLQQVEDTYSKF